MDLKLDVNTHDLVFENGSTPTTGDMVDVVRQRLYIRLRTFKHEWFLSYNYGVPWLEKILGHKVKKSTVDIIMQEHILSVQGVERIVEFSSSFDNNLRNYSCRFRVRVKGGGMTDFIEI